MIVLLINIIMIKIIKNIKIVIILAWDILTCSALIAAAIIDIADKL